MNGRVKAALALGLLLVPGLVLVSFVVGLGNPDSAGAPTASYSVDYNGRALIVTQEAGRVRSGTLTVVYGQNDTQEVWVAPDGTGYDNGGSGHPVLAGDQFVFGADVSADDPVQVVWTAPESGNRTVLAETTVGEPKTPSARLSLRPSRADT